MDTIVRPATALFEPPPAPRRRRRRVVLSAIAVGLCLLVFSGVYVVRYQPVSANGTGATWVDPRYAMSLGDFTPPEGAYFSAYRVRYEQGGTFGYALTLHNEGPLPVTITSVGEATDCERCVSPLVFERAFVAPPTGPHQFDLRYAEPFDAFVLESGAFRFVLVEARFDHCESYAPPGGVIFTSIPIGYRAGFIDHEVLVPMPYTLEVRFRSPECPGGLQTAG